MKNLKLSHIIVAFIFVQNIFSQKVEYILTDFGDTYVAEINISNKLFEGTSNCFTGKKEKYSLHKMVIRSIYYMPEKSAFDSSTLKNITYILVKRSTFIKTDTSYCVTIKPSTSSEYVILNRVLDIRNPNDLYFSHNSEYVSGFFECKYPDLFSKYIIGLKMNNQ